jgi:hypothetical protein
MGRRIRIAPRAKFWRYAHILLHTLDIYLTSAVPNPSGTKRHSAMLTRLNASARPICKHAGAGAGRGAVARLHARRAGHAAVARTARAPYAPRPSVAVLCRRALTVARVEASAGTQQPESRRGGGAVVYSVLGDVHRLWAPCEPRGTSRGRRTPRTCSNSYAFPVAALGSPAQPCGGVRRHLTGHARVGVCIGAK